MRRFIIAISLFVLAFTTMGHSQTPAVADYPTKPIRLIVPAAPGAGTDVLARIVADGLTEALKQPVVLDFKPGASSVLGTNILAKSAPDGYTIGIIQAQSHIIVPNIRADMPYDPVKDFAPITKGMSFGFVLCVNPSSSIASLSDLIALAKSKPNQLTFGSAGVGAANHLAGEFLGVMTDAKLKHVPYKSTAPAMIDLLGNHVTMVFNVPTTSIPMMRDGSVRALGYSAINRSKQIPDLPTLDEQGLKGFDVTTWQGFAAPAGTPKPIIDRLHREIMKIFKTPRAIDQLVTKAGNELADDTPEEFTAFIKAQLALYGDVVRKANIRVVE
jgi:tripartite-type tricarboxylate transporter receptor subunit TctC